MNKIIYQNRCRCNEEFSLAKKRASLIRSEGRPMKYPWKHADYDEIDEIISIDQTFEIKYEKTFSLIAKLLLKSFTHKYIYYAIDDILYFSQLKKNERENLLAILYSPIIFLQNNDSINFFDIWIKEISIEEISKTNKFFRNDSQTSKKYSYIKIKLYHKPKGSIKKKESLW